MLHLKKSQHKYPAEIMGITNLNTAHCKRFDSLILPSKAFTEALPAKDKGRKFWQMAGGCWLLKCEPD